jgi:hypothetical protein
MRISATAPLLLLVLHWITVCECLQGSHSYAWTASSHQGRSRLPERSRIQCVGGVSRDSTTLTRLSLESGDGTGSGSNAKDEATVQQTQTQQLQSSSPERQEDQKQETSNDQAARADSGAPTPTPLAAPVRTTSTTPMSTQQLMNSIGTSPRRIFVSIASSTAIALGANFLGVTSKLLQQVPEATVEASGLDFFYPVGDYKRYRGQGYTIQIPKEWVADTTVELAKATRRAGALDYGGSTGSSSRNSRSSLPDAAFGPPGNLNARGVSQGDTNVSVLRAPVSAGFTLRAIGTATSVAETFLSLTLAPKGSGRTATIVDAVEVNAGVAVVGGVERPVVYQFEYLVDRGERGPPLRAISVVCVQGGWNNVNDSASPGMVPRMSVSAAAATRTLLTLTVVAPQQEWTGVYETKLRKIASSFHTTTL